MRVRIDLIVRAPACWAQVPGLTENIRVRSVIGRFLEHTRVFYFRVAQQEDLYLSSADWMNRNMMRRVEWRGLSTIQPCASRSLTSVWWPICTMTATPGHRRPMVCTNGRHIPTGRGAQNALMGRYGPQRLLQHEGARMDLILWRHAEAEELGEAWMT